MAPARLLVISPNHDLQKSFAFALDAEGFDVTTADRLPDGTSEEAQPFACTVVDEKALVGPAHDVITFCIRSHPVIVVGARPKAWLSDWVDEVVVTPDSSGALLAALRRAVGTTATTLPATLQRP